MVANWDGMLILDNPHFIDATTAFSMSDLDLRIDKIRKPAGFAQGLVPQAYGGSLEGQVHIGLTVRCSAGMCWFRCYGMVWGG